ncbi:MAG TPA: hypothetical protein PKN32_08035 [Bacteroidales bacterium]|nr:hypothetical protein [Bacteroidales bacterium]
MGEITEIRNKKKDVTTKVLIALISLMALAIGVLGFMLYDLSQQNKVIIVKSQEVTVEKDNLKAQLSALLDDYDSLQTNNDSLNAEILKEKEHIQTLIKELDGLKSYNYSIQQKYEKELASLRNIMRHYVYQIDSLDQLNKFLIAENINIRDDHNRIKSEMDGVVERNDELEMVIEGASIVKTANIGFKFYNKRGKETEKSSKLEKIETYFTLVANDLASSGPKRVYLRIIRPDSYALSGGQTFDYREKKITYTASRDIIYENQNLAVSIYYDVKEELILGKYIVEIYMDGNKIGESFFTINK